MSSLDLHVHVLADYRDFVRSFLAEAYGQARARQFVENTVGRAHAPVAGFPLGGVACVH